MLVGMLSATPGRLPQAAFAELADCDHIIHAGDICGTGILTELRTLAPVTAVLGNNDFPEYGEDVQKFATPTIGGVKFLVTHTPTDLERALRGTTSALQPGDTVPVVAVHGHTHIPRIETGRAASPAGWLVCPGSVTLPRGGSSRGVAKVTIEDAAVKGIRLVELQG